MNKIIKLFVAVSFLVYSGLVFLPKTNAQEFDLNLEPSLETELAKDILGTRKETEKQETEKQGAKKQEAQKKEEELITFSARNISVKDAFATLARISGKSIAVGSDIRDDETIAVIEIKDQTFDQAFISLIDAAKVNFTTTGSSYTVVKQPSQQPIMIFGLGATAVDKSLPLLERKADLSYDNQDLATLLKDLANKYGIDIVLTATPTERVSARVREVNIDEALQLVLSGTSFDFTKVGPESETYVIYNRLNKNFTVGQLTKMFTLKNLTAMDAQALLPVQVRANVRTSDDQNAVIADGSANDLKIIEDFLKTVDKPLPQVELEVKLIEVSRRVTEDLKIFKGDGFIIGQINRGLTVFDFSKDLWNIFETQLSYLEKLGLAEVRAYPKLVSLSGRTAMINIDTDTNLVLGAATGQGQQIGVVATQQLQRITAGTALNITPIVGEGGLISAMIQIEVSDNSGTTEQNGVKVPETTTRRRINAEVQLKDGETVAIGGLVVDNNSLTRQGFPFIIKIPLIGDYINNRNRLRVQSELIVLITPKIRSLADENVTADELNIKVPVSSG